MAKSMQDFKVRGGPDKKAEKISKVANFRHSSERYRKQFELYWKRDVEDLEGHVDNSDSKKFPYRSRLRIPWPLYMVNAWVDNQCPIILDEDHPIELGQGRRGVPQASVDARQGMLDYFLYKTGFQWKLENFTRSEVGHGTSLWQIVRHAGKAKRDVVKPVVDESTGDIVASVMREEEVYVPYYGPGIEEVSLWDFYPDPGGKYMDTMPRCCTPVRYDQGGNPAALAGNQEDTRQVRQQEGTVVGDDVEGGAGRRLPAGIRRADQAEPRRPDGAERRQPIHRVRHVGYRGRRDYRYLGRLLYARLPVARNG